MITRGAMLKVFFNSFFIQSSWSFEKMQSLGFAAAISPAIGEVYRDSPEGKRAALKRHLAFYNAHPYMASPVLGAAIRLEEAVKEGGALTDAPAAFKKMVMGPYGAIGDSFFWGAVRPAASAIGVLIAALFGLWGAVVFLALYNIFHLWMRWMGLKKGYELGAGVVAYVKSLRLPEKAVKARFICMLALGFFCAAAPWSGTAAYFAPAAVSAALLAGALILNEAVKRGVALTRLIYMVILPLIVIGAAIYG
ncbi:MAG: PTS system mannose/fructose/sorbose family transporter subunit IID [Deltaproteobacteria bacterium]|nr:PTS system mannose/fructose/sorbose family transporter subunit IID [Deltaproteobacteria bacterium]